MLKRLPRAVLVGTIWSIAVIAAGILGFGVASAVVSDSGTPPSPEALIPAENARTRVAARDLSAGSRPWAVRVYRSQTGLVCPEAGGLDGTLRGNDFGTIAKDGSFDRQALAEAAFGHVEPASGEFVASPARDQGGSGVDAQAVE